MMSDERCSIACPLCNAPAGQDCRNTSNGRPFTGFIHRERITAWKEALRGV